MPGKRIEIIAYIAEGLPCKKALERIKALITLLPKNYEVKLDVKNVDDETFIRLLLEEGIGGLPYIIVKKNGEEVKIEGYEPDEIDKAILGYSLSKKGERAVC